MEKSAPGIFPPGKFAPEVSTPVVSPPEHSPLKSMHGNNIVWLCTKYAVDANLFPLESSILTRAKRVTSRNNIGGNIRWGNIPGWNVPGGVYLEPNHQHNSTSRRQTTCADIVAVTNVCWFFREILQDRYTF